MGPAVLVVLGLVDHPAERDANTIGRHRPDSHHRLHMDLHHQEVQLEHSLETELEQLVVDRHTAAGDGYPDIDHYTDDLADSLPQTIGSCPPTVVLAAHSHLDRRGRLTTASTFSVIARFAASIEPREPTRPMERSTSRPLAGETLILQPVLLCMSLIVSPPTYCVSLFQ